MATPPLNPYARITDDQGRPTPDFMQWWQAQRSTNDVIVPLGTPAQVSAVLDVLGAVQGGLLFRGPSTWGNLTLGTAGQLLASGGPEGSPTWVTVERSFVGLADTPNTYLGQQGRSVRVNPGETGLEFFTPTVPPTAFTNLTDTPSSYVGQAGMVATVNATEDGLEFVTGGGGGGGGGGSTSLVTVTADTTLTNTTFSGLRTLLVDSEDVVNLTIPPGLTGTEPVTVMRKGAGGLLFEPGAGVTLRSGGGGRAIRTVNAGAVVHPIGVNDYWLNGDMATVSKFGGALLSTVAPAVGWGTVLRNQDYSGPCLRVGDTGSTAETDMMFDSRGFLTGALPYGANTRVVRVYDQWGSTDLFATTSSGLTLVNHTSGGRVYETYCIMGSGAGYLESAVTNGDNPPWAMGELLWLDSVYRTGNPSLAVMWGVASSVGAFMGIGMWQESNNLNWRINGSGVTNWAGTNWVANAAQTQFILGRCIGDMTQADGQGYSLYNGANKTARPYTSPISYSNSALKLGWFGASILGNRFVGGQFELHLFSKIESASDDDIATLDSLMSQIIA